MKYETQVEILNRLLKLRERGTFEMADEIGRVPVSRYIDPATYEKEMATVFRHFPQLAGHASHVRELGSFIVSDWDHFPYVIVRGHDGVLRGFLNQCRHRGARLVSESTKQKCLKTFVCPFHGWVYDLDGSLRSVSREFIFPGLDRCQHGLIELPVAERSGLVWIHPTPNATIDLDNYLGPIADDIDHFDLDGLVSFRKSKVIRSANWKLLIKTYLEGYHVPFLHRTTLAEVFHNGVIESFVYEKHIRLAAARKNICDAHTAPESEWRILDYASVYYSLFPHAFLILHPDYVSINMFHPLGAERTLWTHEMLYRPADFVGEKGQAALTKRFEYTNDVVFDKEDFLVAEDVQRGMRYGANTFHVIGTEEALITRFQANIDQATGDGEYSLSITGPLVKGLI